MPPNPVPDGMNSAATACAKCGGATSPSPTGQFCLACVFGALGGPDAADDLPELPNLEVLDRLGAGGFGVVYLARETTGRRELVAVKVLRLGLTAAGRDRFRREADLLDLLKHQNIAALRRTELDGPHPHLVMDAVAGDPLGFRLKPGCQRRASLELIVRAAQVVQFAHSKGVFHLDLTPANVLVGDGDEPTLIDFGCARLLGDRPDVFAEYHVVQGTAGFIAPEVLAGDPGSSQADVYSLGAILAAYLVGTLPRAAPQSVGPACGPTDLRLICEKCLDPDPARRYSTADEFANELTTYLNGYPPAARKAGPLPRAGYWAKRNRVPLLLALVLSVLFAIVWAATSAVRAAADRTAVLVADGDRAFARGDWYAARANYDAAIARGTPERPRLEVVRLRCDLRRNVGDPSAEAARLLDEPAMRFRRADLLLLRAEVHLADQDGLEVGKQLLREALASDPPLGPGDAAYADGLLAAAPADGLAAFRTALSADPGHYPAHAALAAGLALTGQRDDARAAAAVMRRTFPTDPLPDLVDALVLLFDGADDPARRAWKAAVGKLTPGGLTAADFDVVAEVVRTSRQVNAVSGALTTKEVGVVFTTAARVEALRSRSDKTRPLGVPAPVVAWWFEAAAAFHTAGTAQVEAHRLTNIGKPAEATTLLATARPGLDAAADRFGSAELFYLAACQSILEARLALTAGRPADSVEAVRAAAGAADRAAHSPSMFPGTAYDYHSLTLAALAEGMLLHPDFRPFDSDPTRERRQAALLREIIQRGAAVPALRAGNLDVLRVLLKPARWQAIHGFWAFNEPDNPDPWYRIAAIERENGDPKRELEALAKAEASAALDDETLRAAIAAAQERALAMLAAKSYPGAAAAAGPAGVLAIPGVRRLIPRP